jgi:hypothetical protein
MQLLPELVLSILEFCADMNPVLALLIMTRTGALHYRNACAHILYRLAGAARDSWCGIRIPWLLSHAWACAPMRHKPDYGRTELIEGVIRTGITVPGRSCPLWCYRGPQDRK